MKSQILKMLRNSQDYVSGQSICNVLGVSRTAVWKYINQLKEEGYDIDSVPNKGYFIAKYPDIVSASEVMSCVDSEFVACDVIFFEQTDSTNNQAKKLAEDGAAHGTLVIAENQNGGRGRRGRQWVSHKGQGIFMSLILRPDIKPYSASMLTLIAAMAVTQSVRNNYGLQGFIKWPNDVIVNKKKICGILTEMSADPDFVNYIVTGIGINVNVKEIDEDIKDKATSLLFESGKYIRRSDIINSFVKEFEKYYNIFLVTKDMSALREEYNSMLYNAGKEVRITDMKHEFIGIATGINDKGELLVKKEDGSLEEVMAGEVSVRGLNGYV